MKTLILTTSSACAGLALTDDSKILFVAENPTQRTHSDWIHVALSDGLKQAKLSLNQIDRVAVDYGPGSFTGIRVGFNLAKTLSFTQNLPLLTLSSVEILLGETAGPAIAMTNAFRNMVYFCEKDNKAQLSEASCRPVTDIVTKGFSGKPTLFGDAFNAYPELREVATSQGLKLPTRLYPSVETFARLLAQVPDSRWTKDWKSITPLYLRDSGTDRVPGAF